jgi:hypothetical protein
MVPEEDALLRRIEDAKPDLPRDLTADEVDRLKFIVARLRPLPPVSSFLVRGSFDPDPAIREKYPDPCKKEREHWEHLMLVILVNERRLTGSAEPPISPATSRPHEETQTPAETAVDQPSAGHSTPQWAADAPTKPKRSTEPGEGRKKLIAALTKHHKYADGSCLNVEPIGNNELARKAVVAQSTASAFFKREFEGHTKYKALCRDPVSLAAALKLLNGEYSPHDLYGGSPADERNRDDE